MCIMLCKYTKLGNLKYISHLDVLRFVQRAVRRASLPVAYSEGFNPHMKTSFGFPLSLGNESRGEYFEIELAEKLSEDEFKNRLNNVLPHEMQITACTYRTNNESIMSICKYVRYIIEAEAGHADLTALKVLLSEMAEGGVTIERHKKNKKNKPMVKYINTADMIQSVEAEADGNDRINIEVVFRTEETGSMKTDEFMKVIEGRGIKFPYYTITKIDSYDSLMKPLM